MVHRRGRAPEVHWRRGMLAGGAIACSLLWTTYSTAQTKVVTEGDTWRYFKGTEEPPADWNTPAFDDSAWLEGPSPFGYGDGAIVNYGTILDDMQNGYLSVYIRIRFTISSLDEAPAITLRMRYDDGFAAYINGTEIVRRNIAGVVGTPIPFDQVGLDHETNAAYEDTVLCSPPSLQAGENVLAITGHNVNLPSSDLTLAPELVVLTSLCPTNMTCRATDTPSVLLRWTKPTSTFSYDEIIIMRNGARIEPGPTKTAASFTDRAPVTGVNDYQVIATGCGVACTGAGILTCSVTVGGGGESFRRGDADANGSVNITDSVFILDALFRGGPQVTCPDAADADDNAAVNITDAVYLLDALFRGGPQPPPPGTDPCGADPSADELGACTYTAC